MRYQDLIRALLAGAAIYTIIAACSDKATNQSSPVPNAKADPTASGSRLRAKRLQGSDGSKQFVGWFDSERGEDCSVNRTTDGQLRCTPAYKLVTDNLYEDASCTQRITVAEDSAECPDSHRYVVRREPDCSGSQVEYFEVGEKLATKLVYGKLTTACIEYKVSETGNAYRVGAPIPSESFVELTETVDE